ncbi:hypothetical protein K503DRAFT_548789 [Rhizopogon vinicolor AM-OR11-026]|uniref:Uncharacterized protein n=1 Tax=Rhizopogon vinicolor AM-OR11-026 TaxID=1314800 RepID=A0A1B7MKR1_9AGAM|nr:hypothetical protein K503DRAFT_548789 [Rhizopogon vinicolor AM-OR11-026]
MRLKCSQPIMALAISLTDSLLVGTATGLIHLYAVASHQRLCTTSTHDAVSISHLATMLKPPDLIGHISLSLNLSSSFDAKDVKAREAHEVMVVLPVL